MYVEMYVGIRAVCVYVCVYVLPETEKRVYPDVSMYPHVFACTFSTLRSILIGR